MSLLGRYCSLVLGAVQDIEHETLERVGLLDVLFLKRVHEGRLFSFLCRLGLFRFRSGRRSLVRRRREHLGLYGRGHLLHHLAQPLLLQ